MGNEMGNNNTSGFHEEDNANAEADRKSLQETVHVNGVQGENHVVPTPKNKDYHEKETELASDVPNGAGDDYAHNRTSDGTVQQDAKVHLPSESPKAEMNSDGAGDDHGEDQTASLPNEPEEYETSTESNLEDNQLLTSHNNQLEKQASFSKEEDKVSSSTSITASPSHGPEPQNSEDLNSDQHEFAKIHAEQSLQQSSNSWKGIDDIQGSEVAYSKEENGHHLDDYKTDNLDENVSTATYLAVHKKADDLVVKEMTSQRDQIATEVKFDVGNDVEDGLNDTTPISSEFLNDDGGKSGGELTNGKNGCENSFLKSNPKANGKANFPEIHIEVSIPEDKCIVLSEDTSLIEKESENGESEELAKESETQEANARQSDSLLRPGSESNETEDLVSIICDPASNGDCQQEVNVAHNVSCIEFSEENCEEPKVENVMVTEFGVLPAELSISNGRKYEEDERDCILKADEPAEKQVVKEIEKAETSSVTATDMEESGIIEQFNSHSLPAQSESFLPCIPASLFQCQDYQQENLMGYEADQCSSKSILELKSESCSELFVTMPSTFHSTSFTAGSLASVVELGIEKPLSEAQQFISAAPQTLTETKASAFSLQSSEECEVVKIPVFSRDGYEAMESVERLSTDESNYNNFNIHMQMRKSPSFSLDLRSEESDQTPLLYQDKTTIENLSSQADVTLQHPLLHTQYDKESPQHQTIPVEEVKVITLDRSDSEKSKTPFLGFLKQDEEAHVAMITPRKQNQVTSKKNSPTVKEKHKRRSSLFANCMCCTTVIN